MNTKTWKNNELNRLLMEKFNFKADDDREELDEMHGGCGCEDKHPDQSHDEYTLHLSEESEE